MTEVTSGARVSVQWERPRCSEHGFEHGAQRAPLLGELPRHAHAGQRHRLLPPLHRVVAALPQVVSHAHDVSKLPLLHSTEGCTEAPNLQRKMLLGSQCFKIPELSREIHACATELSGNAHSKNQHDKNTLYRI